jgi:glycerophosphoryl diester phosphodiesterase
VARTDYFAGDGLRLLAHRGLWQHTGAVAENTLEAFAEALSFGATHIESDVHVTADGRAVLFHDDSLKRVAGINRRISDLTLAQIREIKLEHGGSIPLLAEALSEFPEARFNLDLKSAGAIAPAVCEIEAAAAHQRILISSFSEARRQAALAQLSRPVATSSSSPLAVRALLAYRFDASSLRAIAGRIDALQVPPKRLGFEFADAGFVTAVTELGLEIHFWTINDLAQMRTLVAMGAHGLVSDRVDLAVKLL